MAKDRARRDERAPEPDQLVVRGVLGDAGLDPEDLRANAVANRDLYGFFAISVWLVGADYPLGSLEQTKLVKFDQYAEFVVADLVGHGLELWATGQSPHYDVVHSRNDLDALVEVMVATPHQVRSNPHVDREEH